MSLRQRLELEELEGEALLNKASLPTKLPSEIEAETTDTAEASQTEH